MATLCCFIKCDPCCLGKRVVIMPFEQCPPPLCCCSNRVGCCDNNCGCCGPVTGNPKLFLMFAPQPKNAAAFVQAAKNALLASVRGSAPSGSEMER